MIDITALKIAIKIIKLFEGCNLISYPDPASPLYTALSTNGMLQKYMRGAIRWKDLPEHFQALDGRPFTCGHGETKGVTHDTVWTQQEADSALQTSVEGVMSVVMENVPQSVLDSPERIAACTSLAYNIGLSAFKRSTVLRMAKAGKHKEAAEAFKLFNLAGGKIMDGLVKRRKIEADLYISVRD